MRNGVNNKGDAGFQTMGSFGFSGPGQALVSAKLKRELKAKDASMVLKNEIKGS